MATQKREIIDEHIVERNKPVNLTITIGNLQIGGSRVKWAGENEYLGKGQILNLPLGNGADVVGRKLHIVTNFYDQNPDTNFVSAMYEFNNGQDPIHVYFDAVKDDGDFFVFDIEMTFK